MSSSSSLSGARRRRAGGGSGPTSTSTTSTQPPQRAPSNTPAPQLNISPFQLIQQHESKLNMLRETLQQVISEKNNTTIDSESINDKINIDVEKISNFVMGNVEKQLDLKAFYDNDEKLMNEIESLKLTLQSQQMVINGLSTALYSVVSKLNLALPNLESNEELNVSENVSEDVSENVSETEEKVTQDNEATPTFPKAVSIVEGDNTTMEFYPMEDDDGDDHDDNYELVNPPVD